MHLSLYTFTHSLFPASSRDFEQDVDAPTAITLASAFERGSPRVTGVHTPWRSALIHAAVLLSWLALCAAALGAHGLMVWSIGLFYMGYDLLLQGLTLLQTWRLTRPMSGEVAVVPVVARRLAVVVAAHNEADVLETAIAGLLAQTRPPDVIVIADDGSTDGTANLLMHRYGLLAPELGGYSRSSPQVPGLHWLRLPHGGKAQALNQAILHVDTDIVLTVDADTLLDKQALSAMYQAFVRDPDLVAATGVLTPVCSPGWRGRILEWFQSYEYVRNFLARYAWMRLNGLLLISGAFAAFRRQALVDVGGFDDDCLVEDYELIHRLRRYSAQKGLNWTTAVIGQARAWTDAPSDVRSFLRQRRRWFGGFLQTQYWYRDMVGQPRYGEVGMRMLPIKAFDTLQPLFGVTSLLVLLSCVVRGRWGVLWPVAGVMAAKTTFDLAFHAWAVVLYRRWTGAREGLSIWGALTAALIEPWSFQVLRHMGALWGWAHFLKGRQQWEASSRGGLINQRYVRHAWFGGVVLSLSVLGAVLVGSPVTVHAAEVDPRSVEFVAPKDVKWVRNAAGTSEQALLFGDPAKPGPYVVQIKWLPGNFSRPHFHNGDRFFAVLSGTWWVGTGETFDPEATVPMTAGSYVIHHGGQVHYDGAKNEEAIIQVWGVGPVSTTPAAQAKR